MSADLFTSRLVGRRYSDSFAPPALTHGYIPRMPSSEKTAELTLGKGHFQKPTISSSSMKEKVVVREKNLTRRASVDLLQMLHPIAAKQFPRHASCHLPTKAVNEKLKERYPIPPDARVLGEGGFGKVFEIVDQVTKKKVAAKVNLEGTVFDLEELVKLNRVQELPYVIALLNHFQLNEDQHVLILEEVGDNLSTALRELQQKKTSVPLDKIKDFMRKFLTSLASLHKEGITHGDLKTSNLFYSLHNGMMRLLDFGLSKHVDKDDFTSRVCNTQYRAPEVCLGAKYGPGVDIFSAGCILYKMFALENLFPVYSRKPLSNISDDLLLNPDLVEEAHHLSHIQQLLGPIPTDVIMEGERSQHFFAEFPGYKFSFLFKPECSKSSIREKIQAANDVRKDPVADRNDLCDLLEQMLDPNPQTRITALEALKHPFLQMKPMASLKA